MSFLLVLFIIREACFFSKKGTPCISETSFNEQFVTIIEIKNIYNILIMNKKYLYVYNNLISYTRNKALYKDLGREDNFSDRLTLFLLHFAFLLKNFKNEQNKIILQEIYSSGKLNGTVKTFHDEGSIYEIKTYKENILSGIWKQFFLNGQLKLEGSYEDGKRHGLQKYFFPNGVLYSSGTYNEDNKFGEWEYFNNEGTRDTIINYNE